MDKTYLRTIIEKPQFETIKIYNPPEKSKKVYFNWSSSLVQCLTSAFSFSLISFIITKQVNITLLAAFISAAGSFISDLLSFYIDNKHRDKELQDEHDIYMRYIDRRKNEIEQNKSKIREYYRNNYPHAQDLLLHIENNSIGDRNISNKDFLDLTLGDIEEPVQRIELPSLSPDQEERYFKVFDDLQKTLYIKHSFALNIMNKTVVCTGEGVFDDLLKGIVLDLCYHQSYSDIQIAMILNENHSKIYPTLYNGYDYSLISDSEEKRDAIISYLLSIFQKRNNSKILDGNKRTISGTVFPYYVLIAEENVLSKQNTIQLASYSHDEIGFSLIVLSNNTFKYISISDLILERKNTSILIHDNERNPIICEGNCLDISWKEISEIINKKDGENVDYLLFRKISFSDGIRERITKEYIENNWFEHNDDDLIKVPIAIDENNSLFYFSPSELRHGPHFLVTGMTGSGKSEFLITFILSLIINYSSKRVNLYLMDFKGGYLVDLFKNTPQFVMGVSNLQNPKEVENFYSAIELEIRRRENLLRLNNRKDLRDYNINSNQKLSDVFIIIDEFAELKRVEPELMHQIIRVGLIGRSLGVHIVLTTQRPAGVVDDTIFTCMSSVICFRSSREDSYEVLHSPIASDIINPGRCFLAHNNIFYELQVLYSGDEAKEIGQMLGSTVQEPII